MIKLTLPMIPPSTNNAYTTIFKQGGPGGKGKSRVPLRVLTTEGKKFKKEATAHLAKNHALDLANFVKNAPYILHVRFNLHAVQNKGWPDSAKSRYKKLDATNRVKLLEDVLAEVAAVDDSCFMLVSCEKRQVAEVLPEHCEIWFWNLDQEGSPFENAALSL